MPNKKLNVYLGLIIVITLTLACFQMAFVITDGLVAPNNTVVERNAFIQNNLLLWQFGWFNWMLGALGLLTFCTMLLPFIPKSEWRVLGILLVALGIVPDIGAEVIFAFVIPYSPAIDPSLAIMHTLELLAVQLTGTLGNGLYNIGGLILNILLLSNPRLPRKLILIGIPGWFLGFGLSIACALHALDAAKLFTAVAMVWSTAWMLGIILKVFTRTHELKADY
ncbi:MAG: hypothetical protein AAGC78_00235 [Cellvibrio sp.]|uniref:hypothetical protein n=1 Tax=Cellvibrio sp. TaxID=1965322 RepID=UPI0031A00DDB